jgi:hypothetical protein
MEIETKDLSFTMSLEHATELRKLTSDLMELADKVKDSIVQELGDKITEEKAEELSFGIAATPWVVAIYVAQNWSKADLTNSFALGEVLGEEIYEEQWGWNEVTEESLQLDLPISE